MILVNTVCAVAGSVSFLDDVDAEARHAGLARAVSAGRTQRIFDWLVTAFSYQGISDQVAQQYIDEHGNATWAGIEASLTQAPSCPKLRSYWAYEGCRYDKTSFTCSEPEHIHACTVPRHRLRNGRLNQTAYSLFLFIRDVADGDLIGWFDRQLEGSPGAPGRDLEAARQEALIGPLRNIYGVSDKVLTMALSTLFIGSTRSTANLVRVRQRHDRGRYPRPCLPSPDRHSSRLRYSTHLWCRLLPTGRLRRDH